MIKICEVKVPLSFKEEDKLNAICQFLGVSKDEIESYKLVRKAIDARHKKQICYSCNFLVQTKREYTGKAKFTFYSTPKEMKAEPVKDGARVVVVGSGPSGLFAALKLAECGARVTILERGKRVEERQKIVDNILAGGKIDPSCNIQFGEGGAGTFSDGKLNSGINSPLVDEVLNTFYKFGAPEDILFDSHPHIGTDILRKIIVNLRNHIVKLGGKVQFDAKFTAFERKNREILVKYESKNQEHQLTCDELILALGYSARDTHAYLCSAGIEYRPKAFSLGYRIEHLQSDINKMLYANQAAVLPPAPYKFFAHLENRTVYTFCNCPGGYVIPAMSAEGEIVTNGMSYHDRAGENANSALLISVDPSDFGSELPLAGMHLQERLEREAYEKGKGKFIVTRVEDFLKGRSSASLGKVKPTIKNFALGDVSCLLPKELVQGIKKGLLEIDKKQRGFADPDALLTGIETRSSAPFMVYRDENMMTNVDGVYASGEGAGRAGGIVSAAVDGIKIATKIIEKHGGRYGNY